MDITTSHREGVAIIVLFGRTDTTAAPQPGMEISTLAGEGKRQNLLDFREMTPIRSGGQRLLTATAKKLSGPDDRSGLSSLNVEVNTILKFAGFNTISTIFSTVGDAT